MKIIAVSELEDSTFRESPKNAGVYLEISLLDCLTTKKFQDFSGLSRTLFKYYDFPGLSRTGGNHVKEIIFYTNLSLLIGLVQPSYCYVLRNKWFEKSPHFISIIITMLLY